MSVLEGFGASEAGEYVVVSQSGSQYDVDVLTETCTCPDHEHRQNRCKHLRAVAFASGRREIPAWVDRDAIENTLGDHIEGGPVFADAVEAEDDATAEATERAVTDGGTVVSDAELLGSGVEDDEPECVCELDPDGLGCFEHYEAKADL